MSNGILYVCATPIGNLEDVTHRAIRILREVDLIAAEDTRITRRLLARYDVETPLTSCFEHSPPEKIASILRILAEGKSVALVCNAGTPGISDPGVPLIQAAVAAKISVVPIPGPCAAVAALSASGFSAQQFRFHGFLPRKSGERRSLLLHHRSEAAVSVFYESPRRVVSTLTDILETWGDRQTAVFREITKVFEECVRGTVAEVLSHLRDKQPKGEFVIVVEGSVPEAEPCQELSEHDVADWLSGLQERPDTSKALVALVMEKTGWSRNRAYRLVIRWKQEAISDSLRGTS